jgi:hypothetical protein
MRKPIQREVDIDPMDGGIDIPDGGDGITRYPQDGDGSVIEPSKMPDYVEDDPNKDAKVGNRDKYVNYKQKDLGRRDKSDDDEGEDDE